MEKNEKRNILRRQSLYKRKWKVIDEFQFQWIMFMLKKDGIRRVENLRPNVRNMLLKHGKNVEQIGNSNWEIF